MEAVYGSPAAVQAAASDADVREQRRFRVRRSSLVVAVYVLLQTSLLVLNQVEDGLAYASILAPLVVCLLYAYFFCAEERQQTAAGITLLAAEIGRFRDEAERSATDKLLLFEQLARERDRCDKAIRVKDQFLGVLSHELRTPLNVVMGYARLLKERMLGDLEAGQAEAIAKIVAHARDQLAMVTNILEITSLHAGEASLRRQQIALAGLLDDLRGDYDDTQRRNIELVWDYPEDLPVVAIDGDKLKHLLRNLVDNAVKFTPDGAVTVSARLALEPSDVVSSMQRVEFSVRDTGIGIAAEHLPNIFDMFHQVDGSTTRAYGGVGMGLYVVKRLAALLGASVAVESAPGCGSEFTVSVECEPFGARLKRAPAAA